MIKLSSDMNNRNTDVTMSGNERRKRQLDAAELLPPRKRERKCAGETSSVTSTPTGLGENTIRPNVPHDDEAIHRLTRKEVLAQM